MYLICFIFILFFDLFFFIVLHCHSVLIELVFYLVHCITLLYNIMYCCCYFQQKKDTGIDLLSFGLKY